MVVLQTHGTIVTQDGIHFNSAANIVLNKHYRNSWSCLGKLSIRNHGGNSRKATHTAHTSGMYTASEVFGMRKHARVAIAGCQTPGGEYTRGGGVAAACADTYATMSSSTTETKIGYSPHHGYITCGVKFSKHKCCYSVSLVKSIFRTNNNTLVSYITMSDARGPYPRLKCSTDRSIRHCLFLRSDLHSIVFIINDSNPKNHPRRTSPADSVKPHTATSNATSDFDRLCRWFQ